MNEQCCRNAIFSTYSQDVCGKVRFFLYFFVRETTSRVANEVTGNSNWMLILTSTAGPTALHPLWRMQSINLLHGPCTFLPLPSTLMPLCAPAHTLYIIPTPQLQYLVSSGVQLSSCECLAVSVQMWVSRCECHQPVSVLLWVSRCECRQTVSVLLWVSSTCECLAVSVQMWVSSTCECLAVSVVRPVSVLLWVSSCEFDLWVSCCECLAVSVQVLVSLGYVNCNTHSVN